MASNRIGRINEEIQRELSALIPAVKDPPGVWDDLGDSGGDHPGSAVRQGIYQCTGQGERGSGCSRD